MSLSSSGVIKGIFIIVSVSKALTKPFDNLGQLSFIVEFLDPLKEKPKIRQSWDSRKKYFIGLWRRNLVLREKIWHKSFMKKFIWGKKIKKNIIGVFWRFVELQRFLFDALLAMSLSCLLLPLGCFWREKWVKDNFILVSWCARKKKVKMW